MDLDLSGRRVFVTGGSSGIGRACVLGFAQAGAQVCFIGRNHVNSEETISLVAEHGFSVHAEMGDITDEDFIGRAVAHASHHMGGIDAVVHCAAISGPVGRPLTDVSVEEKLHTIDVNLLGALIVAKAVYPSLAQAQNATMVFLGSDSASVATPEMVIYNATKAAVVHLMRSLALEWETAGIRVNAVSPSIVDTPMARADLGLEEIGFATATFPVHNADDIAHAVMYLTSPLSGGVNGHSLQMDFGYSAKSAFPA